MARENNFSELMTKLKENSLVEMGGDPVHKTMGLLTGIIDVDGRELKIGDHAEIKKPYMDSYRYGGVHDWGQRLVFMTQDDTRYDITPEDGKYLRLKS